MNREQILNGLRGMVRESQMKRLARLFVTVPEPYRKKRRELARETMMWAMAMVLDACLRHPTSGERQVRQLNALNRECADYVEGLMPEASREEQMEVAEEMMCMVCYVMYGCCGSLTAEMDLEMKALLPRRFLVSLVDDFEQGKLYSLLDLEHIVDFGEGGFMPCYKEFCNKAGCKNVANRLRACFDIRPMDEDKAAGGLRWDEVFADEQDAMVFLQSVIGGVPAPAYRTIQRIFKCRDEEKVKPFEGFFPETKQPEDLRAFKQRLIDEAARYTAKRSDDALTHIEGLLGRVFRGDDEFLKKVDNLQARPQVEIRNSRIDQFVENQHYGKSI